MADANFPPLAKKLPPPTKGEDQHDYLQRVVALLNDYFDVDLTFAATDTVAVRHDLGRIPSAFQVLYIDDPGITGPMIFAAPSVGWGSKVVYFYSTGACHVRVRLS